MMSQKICRKYEIRSLMLHVAADFKHIVNVKTVRDVKGITTLEGYKDLLIYPPSVLIESEDDVYDYE